jgi:uncharacterized protein (TIGR03000 family)
MLRKVISFSGTLLLAGAVLLEMPSSVWAHDGGGGGGFGVTHFGGGFGGTHFGGYHSGLYRGGYGDGYPHAYHHRYGFYGYSPYSYSDYPYVWSGPAYGSGYDDPYGVGTPSALDGSSSVTPQAASDPSFAPAAASQPDRITHLTVNVPTGARLWLEGTSTTPTGPVRQFGSPPLAPGHRYRYQVRASWDENGHAVTQTQQVEVTAGAHVDVKFPVPLRTAGQTSARKKG